MTDVRSIAVVGRDAPLWLASLALHRALAPVGVAVTAVELPSELSDHHAYAASPALNGLHALVGLDRRGVLQATGGIAVGGQLNIGWSPAPYFTAFDGPRPALGGVDLVQHWTAARRDGASMTFDRLSLAASALARGKVGADGLDPAEFGTIHRGSHLDAAAYSAFLREAAKRADLARTQAAAVDAVFDGTRLVRIETDGGTIDADLFVDATGAAAVLASRQPGDDWREWSDSLPMRRLWWASAPALRPLPPFTELSLTATGWTARIPLAGRTAILAAAADSEAEPSMGAAAGTKRVSPAVFEPIAPGMRSAWRGNVVALGDAACRIEPVDLMGLHLLHVGIANLIAWFPAEESGTWAVREHFNDALRRYGESARDFQAARYRLLGSSGEGWKEQLGQSDWPAALEQRVALFEARGHVPVFDDDSFDEGLWALQLAGLGIVPRSCDPRTRLISRSERQAAFARLVAAIDAQVAKMPTVAADLAG